MTADEFNEKYPVGTEFVYGYFAEPARTICPAKDSKIYKGSHVLTTLGNVKICNLRDKELKPEPPTRTINLSKEQLEAAMNAIIIYRNENSTGTDYVTLLEVGVKLRRALRGME